MSNLPTIVVDDVVSGVTVPRGHQSLVHLPRLLGALGPRLVVVECVETLSSLGGCDEMKHRVVPTYIYRGKDGERVWDKMIYRGLKDALRE